MITNLNSRTRAFFEHVYSQLRKPECHEGVAIIDSLLFEINPHETKLLDAVLDLRTLATEHANATACLEQLFRVRALLDGRYRLAFYRVRAWASRTLGVEVRAEASAPWIRFTVPTDSAGIDEVANTALARIARGNFIPRSAQVRFVFSTERASFELSPPLRQRNAAGSSS